MTSNIGNGRYGEILFGVGISEDAAFTGAHGQAQALIKQTYFAHGQSQSDIEQTYHQHGQAQATILNGNFGYGQAQSNIEQTYNAHGQSQTDIEQTYFQHGQAQTSISNTYYGPAQAEAYILGHPTQHAQSQTDIEQTYYHHGQAQGFIPAASPTGQANALIDPEFYYWRDSFVRTQLVNQQLRVPNIGGTYTFFDAEDDDYAYIDGSSGVLDASVTVGGYVYLWPHMDINAVNVDYTIELKSEDWSENFVELDARYVDNNNYVFVNYFTFGGGEWQIGSQLASINTLGSVYILTPDNNTWYTLRFQVVGNIARFKIWKSSDLQPSVWHSELNAVTMLSAGDASLYFDISTVDNVGKLYFKNLFITVAKQEVSAQAQAIIHRPEGYGQAAARMLHQQQYGQAVAYIIQEFALGQAEGFKDYRAVISGTHTTIFAYSGSGAPAGYDQQMNLLGFVSPWTLPDEGFVTVYLNVTVEPQDNVACIRVNGVDTVFDIAVGTYTMTVYAPAGAVVAPYVLGTGTGSSITLASDSYFRFNYLHENILPLYDLHASVGSDATYSGTITYGVDAPLPAYAPYQGISTTDNGAIITSHTMAYAVNDFSYEVWFKTSSTTSLITEPIINHNSIWYATDHVDSTGLGLSVGTNGIAVIGHRGSAVDFLSLGSVTTAIAPARWHHAFVVVDARTPYVYLDGQLVITGSPHLGFHYRPTLLFNNNYTGSARYAALYDRKFTSAEVKAIYNAGLPKVSGQAQALIITPTFWRFGQAQGTMLQAYPAFAQAQAFINTTKQAQAQAFIRVPVKVHGQAQAYIRDNIFQHGQAQADILRTRFVVHGQAEALISPGYGAGSGQAEGAVVSRSSGFAQARAVVDSFTNTLSNHGQAQAHISLRIIENMYAAMYTYNLTNADTHLYQDMFAYTTEATDPDPVYSGVNPADGTWNIEYSGPNGWFKFTLDVDQTVDITTTRPYGITVPNSVPDTVLGLLTGASGPGSWTVIDGSDDDVVPGDNGTRISRVTATLVAGTYIVLVGGFNGLRLNTHIHVHFVAATYRFANGQAQAQIIRIVERAHGQARPHIVAATRRSAQAQAYIGSFRRGQAQAKIKAVGNKSGQARARIIEPGRFGQAQAVIIPAGVRFAQARAVVKVPWRHGQAQGKIKAVHSQSGQAQALLSQGVKIGQAQAYIKFPRTGQAQALIRDKGSKYGQAQASIKLATLKSGQANGQIVRAVNTGSAQALALVTAIGGVKSGQARAEIMSPNPVRVAQAAAIIDGDGYLVRFNGWTLPGYAQKEADESVMRIKDHYTNMLDGSRSEILGLQNKIMSLKMRIVTPDFVAAKEQLRKAGTIVRSARSWAKLYVQREDRYFFVLTKFIKSDKPVRERHLDYEMEFEGRPWIYGDAVHTITGTGTVTTAGRTSADGGWTPTRIQVSGTNVTISGYNANGNFTGFASISGAVTDLIIDSDTYTVTIGGVNAEPYMRNKDYGIYVGPEQTTFVITGASSCQISYSDRWYL
jgi:hypothetical protein